MEYIFYTTYMLFQKKWLFPGIGKLEYRAAATTGLLLLLNIGTIVNILGYKYLQSNNISLVFFCSLVVLASILYFTQFYTLKKLKKKYGTLTTKQQKNAYLFLAFYFIASIILFVTTL